MPRLFKLAATVALVIAAFAGMTLRSEAAINQPLVGIANTPDAGGYWLVAADGGIFPFGNAQGYGSTGGMRLNKPIVGMAALPDGSGYWLVASDGGIFPFGNAPGYGSTGGIRLNQPIVGMAALPDGSGYWLVASDGGVFPFGNAAGYGSTGSIRLNQPMVGMAVTPDGHGYWLVAADGGIFPFGDAGGYGSTGAMRLNRPIIGMASTLSGHGYWLAAADGGLFPFGDATGFGSIAADGLARQVVGFTVSSFSTQSGQPPDRQTGYRMADANGAVYGVGQNGGWLGDVAPAGVHHGRLTLSPPACFPADGQAHVIPIVYLPDQGVDDWIKDPSGNPITSTMGTDYTGDGGHGGMVVYIYSSAPSGTYTVGGAAKTFPNDSASATFRVFHPGTENCP